MNRAALAARLFLVIVLLPIIGAAGYAAYEYRVQPAIPPGTYRPFVRDPLVHDATRQGFLLGVYAPTLGAQAPSSKAKGAKRGKKAAPPSQTAGLADFSAAIRCPVTVTLKYINWGKPFPQTYVASAAARGSETMVELLPKTSPRLSDIANGSQDRWLKKFAKQILGLRDHIILSFAPEMNGQWYKYGAGHKGSSPADYVRAYRHVHDVVSKEAGRYVTWLWQPSAMHTRVVPGTTPGSTSRKGTPSPKPYWPGRRYVDEIGLDGYYYYLGDTFKVIFGPTIKMLRELSPATPIMIGEVAAAPEYGRQVADIKDLFAGIRKYKLGGLIWFNRNQLTKKYQASQRRYHQDWKLQDNPPGIAAFRAELAKSGGIASPVRRHAVNC